MFCGLKYLQDKVIKSVVWLGVPFPWTEFVL